MSVVRVDAAALLLLLASACGDAAPAGAPPSEPPSAAALTAESETATSSEPPADGSATQECRTSALVLERGDRGPQLCHAVAGSYPPQCGGPRIVGWDWDAVEGEETASGVTWIDAVLIGTWDGERFTVTRPPQPASTMSQPPPVDPAEFAPGCDAPDVVDPSHGRDEVDAVIEPLEAAGVSSIRVSDPATEWDGPFVLTVLVPPGRGEETTALVRRNYRGALCVVERDLPTIDELMALQDEVLAAGHDTPLGPLIGGGPDTDRGVVQVQVLAATDEARAYASRRWGDRVELDPMLRPVD